MSKQLNEIKNKKGYLYNPNDKNEPPFELDQDVKAIELKSIEINSLKKVYKYLLKSIMEICLNTRTRMKKGVMLLYVDSCMKCYLI